jgi:hypothetical protein
MRRRIDRATARRRVEDRKGMALCAAVALLASGWLYGAYRIDKANGITVCQSLANWGFGRC